MYHIWRTDFPVIDMNVFTQHTEPLTSRPHC